MSCKHVGYIKTNSSTKNKERQLDGIILDQVFTDNISINFTESPQLQACLNVLSKGDTLHVYSINHLGRRLKDIENTIKYLTVRGVNIRIHKEHFSIEDRDNIFCSLLETIGAVTEFEQIFTNERRKNTY